MLIEFSVENFLSFKDHTVFSMVASKSFKEFKDTHIINVDDKFSLLKSSIIYGNNASGKSNLLSAMAFMKFVVVNSFRDALLAEENEKFSLSKFALNTQSCDETSFFEVKFIYNSVRYRYGFELDYDKVVSEWLFHTTTKEVFLFKRTYQNIEINKTSFKEAIGRDEDVKQNVLFLSLLATLGKDISSNIVDWFKNFKLINGTNDRSHKRYTIDRLKDDEAFFKWIVTFIEYLEISNISVEVEDVNEVNLENLMKKEKDEEIINLLSSIQKLQAKQPKRDQIKTFHRLFDKENILIGTVPFDFDEQESEGTKKLVYLLGPWYDALKNGKIIVVDELDSRLHSHLTKRLIEFFNVSSNNKAQLICAVHDISLLSKSIFRRDQIWFVEKNQFGVSELYSLADFKTEKVRGMSSFNKNYIEGKFGAIPYFNTNEKLSNLLHENE